MQTVSNILIPLIVVSIIIYGLLKKVDIYSSFIEGVKEGLTISINIFPTIMSMIIAINLITNSGLINLLTNLLSYPLKIINFPKEVLPIALLRPISSSASLVSLNNILKVYGPDSYIGMLSSIIQGSTDTTIYILGMYFSSIGIKKIRYSLIVGLLADFFCVVVSVIILNIIF